MSSLVPFFVNGGVAVVMLLVLGYLIFVKRELVPGWVYRDKAQECEELKGALVAERSRSDAAVAAAAATRDVLIALQGVRVGDKVAPE